MAAKKKAATKRKTATRKTVRRTASSRRSIRQESFDAEPDATFFLKATLFLILGSQWLYLESLPDWRLPIPIGMMIGLVFAHHEHFQIDRKIEYVVLLFAAFFSFWLPLGIIIQL